MLLQASIFPPLPQFWSQPFFALGLALCVRLWQLPPRFHFLFRSFRTVIHLIPFFVCYMDSSGFRFSTAKCFIYTYCFQPWGVSDIPIKVANYPAVSGDCYTRNKYLFFFRFLICKLFFFYTLSLGFGKHTPHLPPATGHTTTISRNSRAVCYFSKSVTLGFATLTPTTNRFFPASSRNFQRQRGAWVLTL